MENSTSLKRGTRQSVLRHVSPLKLLEPGEMAVVCNRGEEMWRGVRVCGWTTLLLLQHIIFDGGAGIMSSPFSCWWQNVKEEHEDKMRELY